MAKVYKNPGPISFTAVISGSKQADMAWIDFPYDLKETFGVGNLVPFKVTFDGRVKYQGSLAKMGGPKAMILLRKDIRAELNKGPGEKVEVLFELDDKPREVKTANDIKKSLRAAGLWEKFSGWPTLTARSMYSGSRKLRSRGRGSGAWPRWSIG